MRRRLPLLLLVALGGCGSSASTIVDAHNAKKLVPSKVDKAAISAVPRPAVVRGHLELGSPNGKWKVSAAAGSVRLLDARTNATLDSLVSRIAWPTAIGWTIDSKAFAVGGKDGRVTVWEEFKHRTYDLPAAKSRVLALAFSPDARLLAAAPGDGGLRIWDLARKKEVARLGPDSVLTAVRFSADGRRVLAGNPFGAWQLTLPR